MEPNGIQIMESLENKSILVTGATGFLAKLVIEKVLRCQPNVKKLFLLVRASDTQSARQRLQTEVLQLDVFEILREKHKESFQPFFWSKVFPISGDIALEGLGMRDDNLTRLMWREINIIINSAATTNFNERYDVALGINTLGAKNVLAFAMRCTKLEMLLHVSTAYAATEKVGIILEKALPQRQAPNKLSSLNIEAEVDLAGKKLMELENNKASKDIIKITMKELGTNRANMFGWANTYSFTKAMGEMLLGDLRGNLPLVILRPTIITSTYKEPFPGWIEGVKTIDLIIMGYGMGQLKCFPANLLTILDMVPVDTVVNAILATIAAHLRQPSMSIYHVGSSVRNPIKIKTIRDVGMRYFMMNPYIKRDGRPIKVGRFFCFPTMSNFLIYMSLRHKLPLLLLWLLGALLCSRSIHDQYDRLDRKYKKLMSLAKAYKPYVFYQRSFDDWNLQQLRVVMEDKGTYRFGFDTKCINWEHYLMEVHIPGLLKYGMEGKEKF